MVYAVVRKIWYKDPKTLKWFSLFVLMFQNCVFWLLSFYTRQFPSDDGRYLSSTVVVVIEFVKIVACLIAIIVSDGGLDGLKKAIAKDILHDPLTTLKVGLPAAAYTVSNNCLFLATTYMDASTAQVLYQGKLLTTAACSVLILQMGLSRTKWLYLVILTMGAMAVQFNASAHSTASSSNEDVASPMQGLMIITLGCVMSSSAGVYFEKVLKGTTTSIWMRNVQLGLFSVLVGMVGVYLNDAEAVIEKGFFQGYSALTWVLVFNQALGGLLVAFACKYANNILKNFACTLSIVLSTLVLAMVFPEHSPLSGQFVVGAAMVLGATFAYGREDAQAKEVKAAEYAPVPSEDLRGEIGEASMAMKLTSEATQSRFEEKDENI